MSHWQYSVWLKFTNTSNSPNLNRIWMNVWGIKNQKKEKMKKVSLFSSMSEFEKFINRTDIEVLQVDVKVVEQSFLFQESFAAVVFYKELS